MRSYQGVNQPLLSARVTSEEQSAEIKRHIDSKTMTLNLDFGSSLSKEKGTLPMSPYYDPYM
jgi:hypothetical protein